MISPSILIDPKSHEYVLTHYRGPTNMLHIYCLFSVLLIQIHNTKIMTTTTDNRQKKAFLSFLLLVTITWYVYNSKVRHFDNIILRAMSHLLKKKRQ